MDNLQVQNDALKENEAQAAPAEAPVQEAAAAPAEAPVQEEPVVEEIPNILRNMTLGKLCEVIEIPCPEALSPDLKLVDVLGSPIAARKGSAVIEWKGERSSGVELCHEALNKGAAVVFCRNSIKEEHFKDKKNVIGVSNASECITKYIKFARDCFPVKVVAVTGSVGKTTTMEMLKCVLTSGFNVHYGKSIDNSRGAIIRLAQQLEPSHQIYLQEVGAAEPHHVESLAKGLCPNVAVITNIGSPHLDKYKTHEGILKDKSTLIDFMKDDGVGVLDMDNQFLREYKTDRKIIYYAIEHHEADYYAENIVISGDDQRFDVVCRDTGARYNVLIHIRGEHNVRNALAAFAVGRHLGMDEEKIVAALATYSPHGVRQNVVEIGGYKVFLDMFNSSPESLIGSIKVLEDMPVAPGGRRIVVAADIARLGDLSQKLHYQSGEAMAKCKVDEIFCFGEDALYFYEGAKKAGCRHIQYTKDREELNNWIRSNLTRDDIILFKGSQMINLAATVDAVFGTTYYHQYQGVFVSTEDLDVEYRHVGDYAECCKVKSKKAQFITIEPMLGGKVVRRITSGAFQECRELTEVVIPDTIVNIGERAFYICPKLTEVKLPKGLLMIERSAFNYCRSLKQVEIPDGVISIGIRAFFDCISLESIDIPASVGAIGKEAFANCPKLVATVVEGSFAHRYCEENEVPFVLKDAVKQERTADEEDEAKYKFGNLYYEKEKNDYQFRVVRKPNKEPRYLLNNKIWKRRSPGAPDTALIACAGDLMCEPVMSEAAYNGGEYFFNPMFKMIAPVLRRADLSLANLETTVTERFPYSHEMHVIKHHTGPRYHCNAPLQFLDALRFAGFDGFVLANNHDADCGYEGIIDTLDNLDEYRFMHTGMFRNDRDPRVLHIDVNGIRIAVLSYTEHINRRMDEEILTPLGIDVMLNRFSEKKLNEDVKSARENGAEFIICFIHYLGNDYSNEVHPKNIETGQIIADAGVDCIIGSHMHAVQRYDVLRTKDGRKVPIIYSMGNFITSESKKVCKQSVIYMLQLQKVRGKVKIKDEHYVPCYTLEGYQRNNFTIYPVHKITKTDETSQMLKRMSEEIRTFIGKKIKPWN